MKKLFALFAIVSLVLINQCKQDDFVVIPGLCPVVIATNPVNTEIDVHLNQIITVTFNERMNPLTFTQASITLQGSTAVEGAVSYTGTTASFKPFGNLLPNTTYTGRVTTAVKDEMGNALQTDYVWTFSTGVNLSPTVISTDPLNNATNVVLNKTITANFSEPMDPLTINNSNFAIYEGSKRINGIVSYNGTTASFKPSSPLLAKTIYLGSILGFKNVSGIAMTNEYAWTFTTGDMLTPAMISTDPPDNATGVILSKTITASLSVAMDPSTITSTSVIIKQGATPVPGTVSLVGVNVNFIPTATLTPNTTYTGRVTTAVKDLKGVSLQTDYVWIFSTGATLTPYVMSTDPANNTTSIILNKIVSARFSVPMNPLTINTTSFTVNQGSTPITGTVSYIGNSAYFRPSIALQPNVIYTGIVSNAVTNVAGTSLANDYIWTFTTEGVIAPIVLSTNPGNNATDIILNKIMTASFSMPMDPMSMNTTTFNMRKGSAIMPGVVTYSGSTVSFTPTIALEPNTTYTGMVTTGARNGSGIDLTNDFIWAFTTGSIVAPTVISNEPLSNAISVVTNPIVAANFSVSMNPLTINATSFTLRQGAAQVAGTVAYSGTTARFIPSTPLTPNTIYTGTINTGVRNIAGTAMANNYSWTFTTKN